jgi:hypothetical protein
MFSILKRAYGGQIETFIKAHINHITKVEFFLAFKVAYLESITIQNAKAGFLGAGLVPFDPQAVISKPRTCPACQAPRQANPSSQVPSCHHAGDIVHE